MTLDTIALNAVFQNSEPAETVSNNTKKINNPLKSKYESIRRMIKVC